jgi:hypothetical protein
LPEGCRDLPEPHADQPNRHDEHRGLTDRSRHSRGRRQAARISKETLRADRHAPNASPQTKSSAHGERRSARTLWKRRHVFEARRPALPDDLTLHRAYRKIRIRRQGPTKASSSSGMNAALDGS